MAFDASLVVPAVPDCRFGATVPGLRRAAVIAGPTGGRRCPRYRTLLKQRFRVHAPWSRSGSSYGAPRSGVTREPQPKSHFKGEAKFFYPTKNRMAYWRHKVSSSFMWAIFCHSEPKLATLKFLCRQKGLPPTAVNQKDPGFELLSARAFAWHLFLIFSHCPLYKKTRNWLA
jgi:hypothetical protein